MIPVTEGRIIAGKYRIEQPLAHGGMGCVWLGRHLQLDVDVAVKFMDPSLAASAQSRARFEREAKASAQLSGPNVVQVHDYGVEDDTPYIVMERLHGEDLNARLAREGRLSVPVMAGILRQICKALRRAHEMGIVHRDLKPANIFLALIDEDEIIKILDFGIAKAIGQDLEGDSTKTGALMGSPNFMSPEQVVGRKGVDHRSDLWSLGIILFRAVTGRLPFAGDQLMEVLMNICASDIPLASDIAPDLGPDVDCFFERALAREPSDRFQSAREMAQAFAALRAARGESYPGEPRPRLPFPSDAEGDYPVLAKGGTVVLASPTIPVVTAEIISELSWATTLPRESSSPRESLSGSTTNVRPTAASLPAIAPSLDDPGLVARPSRNPRARTIAVSIGAFVVGLILPVTVFSRLSTSSPEPLAEVRPSAITSSGPATGAPLAPPPAPGPGLPGSEASVTVPATQANPASDVPVKSTGPGTKKGSAQRRSVVVVPTPDPELVATPSPPPEEAAPPPAPPTEEKQPSDAATKSKRRGID